MTARSRNSERQEYHAISSLLGHYKNKKINLDLHYLEPEMAPRPQSSRNQYLNAPLSDLSFASRSSDMRSSKHSHSRCYFDCKRSDLKSKSPKTNPKHSVPEMERMLIIEQQIKVEKEKYKKLEKKYRKLTATHISNLNLYEDLVKSGEKEPPKKKLDTEKVSLEVGDLRSDVCSLLDKLDCMLKHLNTEERTIKSEYCR